MEEEDFTFPTVVAAPAPEGQLGGRPPEVLHQLPLPDLAAASPLWPFAGPPKATTATSSPPRVAAGEEAPVSASTGCAEDEEDHRGVAADEERMDLLWEGATTAPAPQSTGSGGGGHAEPPPPNSEQRRAEADEGDKQRALAVADAERMDKLWESFNEELFLLRRARSKSAAATADRTGSNKDWFLCNYSPSDAESEETSASSPAGYGCAPTMLRASSRAGGVGQFCSSSSPRGRRRGSSRGGGAAAGWALLLRLFRRLFAVDKAPASSRSHASIYVP
ncbi:hypothetical protein BAE44_0014205 [Dichanthelium oligosanthes]|uniref:Uncharacterized protein n=1 Tax=Dichanthelium oligosanthes TaxID=888268 RepID=A0A1E5VI37_9POAL|nr:hypothetical protein BAE44_0014205 [Dichanthelium oligosanthes]